jgi:hypothetical protein
MTAGQLTYPTIDSVNYAVIGATSYLGKIDSLAIWNKLLTNDEVTQLYNGGIGTDYPYPNMLPSISNKLGVDNAYMNNGAYFTDGKISKAFTFDGVNDYTSLGMNTLNFTGSFSASCWIYANSVTGQRYILTNSNGNSTTINTGWTLGLDSNKIQFTVLGNTVKSIWTAGTISTDTWYHIAVSKTSSTAPKIYINGALQTNTLVQGSDTTNPVYTAGSYPNTYSSIGAYVYTNGTNALGYLLGKVDTLAVWEKEITQEEVTNLYNNGSGNLVSASSIVTKDLLFIYY